MTALATISNACKTNVAIDLLAILGGNATQDQIESHLIRVCEAEVESQINDEVWIDSDENESGKFYFVAEDTITVELEDEALAGWIANDRMTIFSGRTSDNLGWEASASRVVETAKLATLVMHVKSTD